MVESIIAGGRFRHRHRGRPVVGAGLPPSPRARWIWNESHVERSRCGCSGSFTVVSAALAIAAGVFVRRSTRRSDRPQPRSRTQAPERRRRFASRRFPAWPRWLAEHARIDRPDHLAHHACGHFTNDDLREGTRAGGVDVEVGQMRIAGAARAGRQLARSRRSGARAGRARACAAAPLRGRHREPRSSSIELRHLARLTYVRRVARKGGGFRSEPGAPTVALCRLSDCLTGRLRLGDATAPGDLFERA